MSTTTRQCLNARPFPLTARMSAEYWEECVVICPPIPAVCALAPSASATQAMPLVAPDVPTVADFVPGYEASSWFGVAAPKDTPAEVVDILNREINASFADPRIGARLADMSGMALAGLPAVFGRLIADETEKWGRVIRAANIKAE